MLQTALGQIINKVIYCIYWDHSAHCCVEVSSRSRCFQRGKESAHFAGKWNTKKTSSSATSEIARRWSLPCSRSFKVNDAGTSQKPVCDFVRVNTTNLHPYLAPFSSYRALLATLSSMTRGACG